MGRQALHTAVLKKKDGEWGIEGNGENGGTGGIGGNGGIGNLLYEESLKAGIFKSRNLQGSK